MDKDTITQLRDAQRQLDRAIARRKRARERLDQAEEDVRQGRALAEGIGRALQQELNLKIAPGAGELLPMPAFATGSQVYGTPKPDSELPAQTGEPQP